MAVNLHVDPDSLLKLLQSIFPLKHNIGQSMWLNINLYVFMYQTQLIYPNN